MTATAVGLDELGDDVHSDEACPMSNGRYLIVPQGSTSTVSHQRMTNFIKPVDDPFSLNQWELRMVAKGLAHNQALCKAVAATPLDDKKALNGFCKEAKNAARGEDAATEGTATHRITERFDRGEIGMAEVPEILRDDLLAYRRALDEAGIEILEIERYVVHAEYLVAGRFDRIVSFGSEPHLFDIKTGATLDFGALTMAAQLYGYASADTIYDPKTCKHRPMPEVRTDVGMIAHLRGGACTLYWVDLSVGKRAFELCRDVREIRRTKDVMERWEPATRLDNVIERRTALVARIQTLKDLGHGDRVAGAWPPGVPTLKQSPTHTPDQLTAIHHVLLKVEADVGAPFGPADASTATNGHPTKETP